MMNAANDGDEDGKLRTVWWIEAKPEQEKASGKKFWSRIPEEKMQCGRENVGGREDGKPISDEWNCFAPTRFGFQ